MFIWTCVYLNKSKNKINQSFLYFLSLIMLWMILSEGNKYLGGSFLALTLKTIYWHAMLNLSILFLLFVYRFLKRELDVFFYIAVGINSLTILLRYYFPIDYSDPTFWRLSFPIIAPLMSFIFTLPAVYSLYLMVSQYYKTNERRLKKQLRSVFLGIIFSCAISVITEYILPVWYGIKNGSINLSIFVLVLFLFHSILKNRFLAVSSTYLFEILLSNANDGIIIVDKKSRISSINEKALKILNDANICTGDKLTDYIQEYSFTEDYHKHEITLNRHGLTTHLLLTQHSIELDESGSSKLLTIVDVTNDMQNLQYEKELLREKAYIDPLTGLFNKLCFIEKYYKPSSESNGQPSTLLFIDIDGFKKINDTFGHLNGDIVLQSLAVLIKSCSGDKGSAFRFGGDEFVVLITGALPEESFKIAENIRTKANQLDFPQIDSHLRLSLSIGLMQGDSSIHEMMRKADIAMYDSKRKGKNMTSVFIER
jgi:diguanylate cyclase (GGDEF) domain